MYLEKLEIQGFKSFASKNILLFPGMLDKTRRGITAIVGPNGSGKSNTADAIRWVLGEQSMKTLRGKKSEDVIFSGSDKKGRLGMCEVSLCLNNEDRQAPVDFSQVVITRRLFRDGESEYLLNGSRVRLSDIQILLAKARFGQKTYSVIGQGVVEGFLNSSLAERKEFFDEATGVKQFQIKRDEALNKLRLSYENLEQAKMLMAEIEPRMKSLTKQVNRLRRREEIAGELKILQKEYYSRSWREIQEKFSGLNRDFLEKEKSKFDREKKLSSLANELEKIEKAEAQQSEEKAWQAEVARRQKEKEDWANQLARVEASWEVSLEQNGQFDLAWFYRRQEDLRRQLAAAQEEDGRLERELSPLAANEERLRAVQADRQKRLAELRQKIQARASQPENLSAAQILNALDNSLNHLSQAEKENDLEKIRFYLREIRKELTVLAAAARSFDSAAETEKYQAEIISLAAEQERQAEDLSAARFQRMALLERRKRLQENINVWEQEQKETASKLKTYDPAGQSERRAELSAERENIKNKISLLVSELTLWQEKINAAAVARDQKRGEVFALQRSFQTVQNELNSLNLELNELQINAARQETKLEDLENEIRQNYGSLKDIREHQPQGEFDRAAAGEKISYLKRQMDLIGGIDPEAENEYQATKERFDFLSGQIKDLCDAIVSLDKIIRELDETIKERFDNEFNNIVKKFDEYFKILFSGGSAKVIKVMADGEEAGSAEEESASAAAGPDAGLDLKKIKFLQKHNATGLAGVEIQATPPGKKIKSIAMLSGGERALTAIAMICAIISANPSPFVVLDEVDAALDESNSERLAKILDDLSHKTQFIVITHNRSSMRRANILYGVTMGDDGISRLLSVKLDEATDVAGK